MSFICVNFLGIVLALIAVATLFLNYRLPYKYIALPLLIIGCCLIKYKTTHCHSTPPSPTLLVGTSADFPPFSYIDNNTITGFDIDIITEIGNRLHTPVSISNMPFGTLLSALQTGSIQVIAAGMTSTPERAQHVLFTHPYLENDPLVIMSLKTSSIKTLQDLNGKEVIVNEGYTADTYLSSIRGPIIRRLKTPAEAFLALTSGRAQAYVTASNTVSLFFKNSPQADTFEITPLEGTAENVAFAISQKYPELLPEIQKILDAMKKEGYIDTLKKKWKLA